MKLLINSLFPNSYHFLAHMIQFFKDEAQTALFKDPVRTAL